MKELIRDYTIKKTMLLDCKTAKRITWTIMACAVAYFGIFFST